MEGIWTRGDVGAVVVGLNFARGVVGVDVECVEVGTDVLDGGEVLGYAGGGLEDGVADGDGPAGDFGIGFVFGAAGHFVLGMLMSV